MRPEEDLPEIEKWLYRALGALSIAFILLFLYTAHARLRYPFSYDQIEGGMVTSVWRIAHGAPLYVKPSLDFVPFLYAPGYFYLAAALTKITGTGYVALRLLSILGTLGTMGVIYAFIHTETKNHLASLAGVGLFAASYGQLQAWYDIGRVDSLFLFAMFLAIYCTRRAPILVAVLVWIVALQIKQTALPVAILVLCADWKRPRRLLIGLALLVAGVSAVTLLMNHLTGGWYSYYLFGSRAALYTVFRAAVLYIPIDLLLPFGLAFLIILAALLFTPPTLRGRGTQFYIVVSFALYASIWFLRAHTGSAVNTLMPAYTWTAVLFGIGLQRLRSFLSQTSIPQARIGQVLLISAATVQLAICVYNPGKFILPDSYRDARWAFEKQLAALPGDIYIMDHSYDAILAGKQPHADMDAFGVLIESPPSPIRDAFIANFKTAADTHVFSGFIFDDIAEKYNGKFWLPDDFLQQYPVRILAASSDTPSVIYQPVEKWIYLPCSALDHDLSQVIAPDTIVSYGGCPNAPALARN